MIHGRLRKKCLWRLLRHRISFLKNRRPRYLSADRSHKAKVTKRALLVHLVEPFFDRAVDVRHQNRFQALELARLLAARGFAVDILAPGGAVPDGTPPFDVVVDLHPGISRYPTSSNTKRIAYITGSNPAFANREEERRLMAIKERRGISLTARRAVAEFSDADLGQCHAMFFIGSRSNLETYANLQLPPVHFIRNFAYINPPVHRTAVDSRSFVFLASGGQVHKGLDLLLEVFAQHPAWTLHVCSNFHEEPDFCRAFKSELFDTQNIVPHGFLALDSERFGKTVQNACFIVLPSCSEANAGSVLSGMAAGLIPIISQACGFDGLNAHRFEDCTLPTIESTLARCVAQPPADLAEQSENGRRTVEELYSPEAFTESLVAAMDATI